VPQRQAGFEGVRLQAGIAACRQGQRQFQTLGVFADLKSKPVPRTSDHQGLGDGAQADAAELAAGGVFLG
jgi:hypothetical protein